MRRVNAKRCTDKTDYFVIFLIRKEDIDMPIIKIRLEHEELSAVKRRATELGIKVEDLAYGALSCSMNHVREPFCRARIDQSISEQGHDLPLWSDSARSVSIYESLHDIHEGPGQKGG